MGAGPDEPLLPWLLRRTNQLFIGQVRSALSVAGYSDLSQRGMWAVHALLGQARSASELVDLLRVTKQAVSPLVEELVVSGYVRRDADPGDRRRTLLQLTRRGIEAARVIEQSCAEVEVAFVDVVGTAELARLRRTLERLLRRAGTDGEA